MKAIILTLILSLGLGDLPSWAGSATLNWVAPTRNTDGSALTNLAGYVIQYRVKGTTTWKVITINNAGATTRTIWGLTPAIWAFRMKSFNNVGVRSNPTLIVYKTIN
jgi:hypothetical protein